jgi:DnaD/phage-associated family protein
MSPFSGFNAPTTKNTPIPAAFFSELLPEINDVDELKVILWAFRCLDLQEGDLLYLTGSDLSADESFTASFGKTKKEQSERIEKALEAAVRRNVLITARSGEIDLYFLNSPRGRAALESLTRGAWTPEGRNRIPSSVSVNRPNIFAIYEQNIGPLTPLIADELRDAEKQYPSEWVTDAFKIAVSKNARSWHYVEAILHSWKEKGRDERDQRSTKENRKLDSEGEFGDYIRH